MGSPIVQVGSIIRAGENIADWLHILHLFASIDKAAELTDSQQVRWTRLSNPVKGLIQAILARPSLRIKQRHVC